MDLIYNAPFVLDASQCNPEKRMPLTLLASRIIDVATEHAFDLNLGYVALSRHGIGWVLSRMTIEVDRWPRLNEAYSLRTWIEGCNRMYSDRCFDLLDADGNRIGGARTVWVAIDVVTRTAADLSVLQPERFICPNQPCPVPRQRKMHAVHQPYTNTESYTFRYCDTDLNGHVNSVRYIEHILNLWDAPHYQAHPIRTFEIAYLHECLANQTVEILCHAPTPLAAAVDLVHGTHRAVSARIAFAP